MILKEIKEHISARSLFHLSRLLVIEQLFGSQLPLWLSVLIKKVS